VSAYDALVMALAHGALITEAGRLLLPVTTPAAVVDVVRACGAAIRWALDPGSRIELAADPDLALAFGERSAILEHDGGHPRQVAEALAALETTETIAPPSRAWVLKTRPDLHAPCAGVR
jgi:hypothetical protein